MKVPVRITLISVNEKNLSIKAHTLSKMQGIHSGTLCMLIAGGAKFEGKIISVTEKDGKLLVPVQLSRSLEAIAALFPYQYKDKDLTLLTAEKVPAESFLEAQSLLQTLAQRTGRSPEDILFSVTEFKPGVGGRTDLRLVSEKQMPVVIDKLRAMHKEGASDTR